MAYLVADKREGEVIPHLRPLLVGSLVEHTINTGDYLICRRTPQGETELIACLERKSLKDFASSFRDGRYENREKMLALRDQTGCQLYWVVEGSPFPKPSYQVSRGVKYQAILTAMTSMPLASGIHILQTRDPQHTAERLRDFVQVASGLLSPYRYPVDPAAPAAQTGGELVPQLVTGRYERDPASLCMDVWRTLPGIGVTAAKSLTELFSVAEFLALPDARGIDSLRGAAGKVIAPKNGRASLKGLWNGQPQMAIHVLSGVNGISKTYAAQIHAAVKESTGSAHPLKLLCGWSPPALGMVMIKQKGRTIRLGESRAKQILDMLHWKAGTPLDAPGAPDAPGVPDAPPRGAEAPSRVFSALENAEADAAFEALLGEPLGFEPGEADAVSAEELAAADAFLDSLCA